MWIYFIVFRAFVMYVAIHHCESVRARTQFELDRLLDEVNPEARMCYLKNAYRRDVNYNPPSIVTFSKTFLPIFLRVPKYCCTFEGVI